MAYKYNPLTGELDYYNENYSFPVNITTSGYVTGRRVGVFAYINGPADTIVLNKTVYQPIEGSFTNVFAEDFILVADPAIEYNGDLTQYFEIHWYCSLSTGSNGITPHIGIKKNTSVITGSEMCTFCKQSGEQFFIAGVCATELEKGDKIQLVITSDYDNTTITIHHFTTTIKEFFD
jgi:hypothetical protein